MFNRYCLRQIKRPKKPIITSSTPVSITNASIDDTRNNILILVSIHSHSCKTGYFSTKNRFNGRNDIVHIKNNHKLSCLCANGRIATSTNAIIPTIGNSIIISKCAANIATTSGRRVTTAILFCFTLTHPFLYLST